MLWASSCCPRLVRRRGCTSGADRAGEKFYPRPLFCQPAARRPAAGPFSSLLPRATSAAECSRRARPAGGDEADDFRLSPAVLRRISSSRPWRRDADQGLTGASLSARYCAVGDVKLSAGDAAAQSAVSRSLLPSIALIRAHLAVVALNGEEDYRQRHLSVDNAFCSGRMWVNPNTQQRQLYDLPSLPAEPVSLTVGYRTLLAATASSTLLHFTFAQLLSGRHGGNGLSDAQRKLYGLVTG